MYLLYITSVHVYSRIFAQGRLNNFSGAGVQYPFASKSLHSVRSFLNISNQIQIMFEPCVLTVWSSHEAQASLQLSLLYLQL